MINKYSIDNYVEIIVKLLNIARIIVYFWKQARFLFNLNDIRHTTRMQTVCRYVTSARLVQANFSFALKVETNSFISQRSVQLLEIIFLRFYGIFRFTNFSINALMNKNYINQSISKLHFFLAFALL